MIDGGASDRPVLVHKMLIMMLVPSRIMLMRAIIIIILMTKKSCFKKESGFPQCNAMARWH